MDHQLDAQLTSVMRRQRTKPWETDTKSRNLPFSSVMIGPAAYAKLRPGFQHSTTPRLFELKLALKAPPVKPGNREKDAPD
jgi:hypothetical protein